MGSQWAAQWKVNSLTDPKKIYTVSVAKTGRWACDCPAHRFAKNGPDGTKAPCKHIFKVQGIEQISTVQSISHNAAMGAAAMKVAKQAGKNVVVVVNTAKVLVIQTRREVCLEED